MLPCNLLSRSSPYIEQIIEDLQCETLILLVVLYGRETWSLILREEHRLRAFENRTLRRIFGRKRDEMMGGWKKLDNEEPFTKCN
jgi:hypothetical protein